MRRARSLGGAGAFRRRVILVMLAGLVAPALTRAPPALRAQEAVSAAQEEARAVARARKLQQAGRLVEARADLERTLARYPASAPALVLLEQIGRLLGSPAVVLLQAERAAALDSHPAIRQVWVRSLAAAGQVDSAVAVARRWADSGPAARLAHAELAAVLARAGRVNEAIQALRVGREAEGEAALYAQELSALAVRAGDYETAAGEWAVMLEWGEAGIAAVEARLNDAGTDTRLGIRALRKAWPTSGRTLGGTRGALELSLRLGELEWSLALARHLAEGTPLDTRVMLLRDYASETRDRGFVEGAVWAARLLALEAPTDSERIYWRTVTADLALEVGNGGEARVAFEAVLRETPPGTEAHRLAARRLFDMEVTTDPGRAETLLEQFGSDYTDDLGEIAGMAADLFQRRVQMGDLTAAREALSLPRIPDAGAGAALELQRGRLALYEGRVPAALAHFEKAAVLPGSEPESRSEAIALASALGRADSTRGADLGAALFRLESGAGPEFLLEQVTRWESEPDAGAPALMSIAAAELARAGFPAGSEMVHSSLVEHFPGAPEAPAALLSLARGAAGTDTEAATAWLERLIVGYPDAALAPVARRLLARISGRVPGT